jgi:hypothetical protein
MNLTRTDVTRIRKQVVTELPHWGLKKAALEWDLSLDVLVRTAATAIPEGQRERILAKMKAEREDGREAAPRGLNE